MPVRLEQTGVAIDFQLFCDPADIVREDVLFFDDAEGGDEYLVVNVSPYPVTNPKAMHVLLRQYQGG